MASRRRVIAAAAGLAAASAVPGCCRGATGGSGAAPAPPPPPSMEAAPAQAAGSAGTKLGPVADVPVGGGKVYEALEVVVTQPQAGRFEGLSAVCTHTGCIVDKVANGLIECPCHGSRYHLDGTVARGPAPRPLTSRPVKVVEGTVVLT
jgi:Rieske Fe-S protein